MVQEEIKKDHFVHFGISKLRLKVPFLFKDLSVQLKQYPNSFLNIFHPHLR